MQITMELTQLKELLKLAQQYPQVDIDNLLIKLLEQVK